MKLTAEVYRRDRRLKTGRRLVFKGDYDVANRRALIRLVRQAFPQADLYEIELHDTYRKQRTIFGHEFEERYDVPYTCSPRSETYWSS